MMPGFSGAGESKRMTRVRVLPSGQEGRRKRVEEVNAVPSGFPSSEKVAEPWREPESRRASAVGRSAAWREIEYSTAPWYWLRRGWPRERHEAGKGAVMLSGMKPQVFESPKQRMVFMWQA
jgi:hypothetical protein